jgi:hypothetical protein
MKGVKVMATFKLDSPPARTGDAEQDLDQIYSYVDNLYAQVRYVLGSIDEENMTDSMIQRIGGN